MYACAHGTLSNKCTQCEYIHIANDIGSNMENLDGGIMAVKDHCGNVCIADGPQYTY